MLTNNLSIRRAFNIRVKAILFSLIFLTTVAVYAQEDSADGVPTDEALVSAGENLFKGNCAQCHAIHDVVVGPALKDVTERRPKEWLLKWVKNSQKVIQSGDEYAVELYNKFNKAAMPSYPFSDDQITSILAYVKVESSKEPVTASAPTRGGEVAGGGSGDTVSSGFLTAILVVLIVVLVLILIVLGLIVSLLTKYLKDNKDLDEADQEVVNQKVDLVKFFKSNSVVGLIIFVFVAITLKTLIDGAFTIGVQQGYMPTQPIAFSHQLHAGQLEIDCNYCHTGVRKAKSANIPSPNICMNCHSQVKNVTGESGISPEIAKIYKAIDYNPETGEYGDNTAPIEWVRIHNLPDLAYFNHSQHVKVAGLECQTCHGPIEEMPVVYQYSTLTMGWCINCHRQTDVNTKGNEYYTKLVELHNETSKEPMKVEDIGGLECAKCHY